MGGHPPPPPAPFFSPGFRSGRSAHVPAGSNENPRRTLSHRFRCHSGEPHIGVPTPFLIRGPLPDGRLRKPMARLSSKNRTAPGSGALLIVGSAVQPGRMSGSGGGLRKSGRVAACWKPLGAPMCHSGAEDILIRGENVLPVCAVSTNGGDSLTFPLSGAKSSAKPRTSPLARVVCSGIGWTKAKHTIAMMVATVAQALTKDRLIQSGSRCKTRASRVRGTGSFSAESSCTGARSGGCARRGRDCFTFWDDARRSATRRRLPCSGRWPRWNAQTRYPMAGRLRVLYGRIS